MFIQKVFFSDQLIMCLCVSALILILEDTLYVYLAILYFNDQGFLVTK